MKEYFLAYLLTINVVTFFLYGLDKWKARRGAWRIPERQLLLFALFGGSIGAILGMKKFRHKTLHNAFRYGLPAILVLHLILLGLYGALMQ